MSALDAMYQQLILEHAKSRSGADLTAEAATSMPDQPGVGQCHQLNPVCGDEITLRLELEAAGSQSTVKGIHWHGDGCAISMASASILSELSEGASPDELQEMIGHFRELMRSAAGWSRTRKSWVMRPPWREWRSTRPGSSAPCWRGWLPRTRCGRP